MGQQISKLKVIGIAERTIHGKRWLCQCACGNSIEKMTSQLTRIGHQGYHQTGCHECAMWNRSSGKNGNCIGGKTRLYKIWLGMLDRCRRQTSKSWKWYGAKGIRVCKEWRSFPQFTLWAITHGYEEALSIDRINSLRNYTPTNCRWLTTSENSRRVDHARN